MQRKRQGTPLPFYDMLVLVSRILFKWSSTWDDCYQSPLAVLSLRSTTLHTDKDLAVSLPRLLSGLVSVRTSMVTHDGRYPLPCYCTNAVCVRTFLTYFYARPICTGVCIVLCTGVIVNEYLDPLLSPQLCSRLAEYALNGLRVSSFYHVFKLAKPLIYLSRHIRT